MVQSLKSGDRKELFAGDSARYLSTGHIVYAMGNSLFAVPFDPDRLEVRGEGVAMVEGVWQFAVSDSGTLVYVPGTRGGATPERTLVWVSREGKEEPLSAPPNFYQFPSISPEGTRVALTVVTGGIGDIWIWDLIRKILTRLTFNEENDNIPIWTPDGKRIVFHSYQDGQNGVYGKASDGTGKDEKLGSTPGRIPLPYSWSNDGKALVMGETNQDFSEFDIGTLSMEGDHARKLLLKQEKHFSMQPKISPNGQWMAYTSNESGQVEIYVRPFPEVDRGKWQVSTSGGDSPLWSPDGRELFYLRDDAVMAVLVNTESSFNLVGTPKMLFRGAYVTSWPMNGTPWDISPDGKRFLMMKESGSTASRGPWRINIVLNWLEELKQRVSVHVQ